MSLTKRSISIRGHRTSIALEDAFWRALEEIAAGRSVSLGALIGELDAARMRRIPPPGLASALRVFALQQATAADKRISEPSIEMDDALGAGGETGGRAPQDEPGV